LVSSLKEQIVSETLIKTPFQPTIYPGMKVVNGVGILSFANKKVGDEDYVPVSIRLDITTIGCFKKGTV